jgi:hypothetical protein
MLTVGVIAGTTPGAVIASSGTHDAATASRHLFITEKAQMRLASAPGVTLKEQGPTTGTFKGTVVSYFTSYSVSKGALVLTAYLPGGAVTMRGVSRTYVVGQTGYAEGTARITHGTGRFAHASGNALRFKAVINRRNFYATAELHGQMSL